MEYLNCIETNTCYGERRVSHAKIKRFSSTPQGEFLIRGACPIIFYCSELYHSSLCQKIVTRRTEFLLLEALKKSSIIRKNEEHSCLFDQKLKKKTHRERTNVSTRNLAFQRSTLTLGIAIKRIRLTTEELIFTYYPKRIIIHYPLLIL